MTIYLPLRPARTTLFMLLAMLGMLAPPSALAEQTAERPNIVFILADDLGYMDINAYAARLTGDEPEDMFFETPHLNELTRRSTAFAQAYSAPLCSPTRSSLMTGRYAARVGFTTATPGSVVTWYNQNIDPADNYLLHDAIYWGDNINIPQALANGSTLVALPAGRPGDLGRDETTLAQAMHAHHSAFIGKWHVGGHGAPGYQPKDHGFEEISFYDAGGSPYFNWRDHWDNPPRIHDTLPEPPRGKAGPDHGHEYLTDELTAQAVEFIQNRAGNDDEPFFLLLSHFAVHTPVQGKQEYIEHFRNKDNAGWNGHQHPVYAAMLKSLDDSVGSIMQTLEDTGLDDNTIVVFMSDNGGVSWRFPHWDENEPTLTDNAPLKGGKAMVFEGGVRVPLTISWKDRVQQNQWSEVPVDSNDLFPTLLEMAGYNPSPFYNDIDGRSIVPLFDDPANLQAHYPRNTFYWHYPFNVIVNNPDDHQPLAPHSAIREGDFKLVHDWSGKLKLYDLVEDPQEQYNLVDDMPRRTQRMFRKLHDWLDANVDVKYHPALNPDYNPDEEARDRPFVDLRQEYLGQNRAIRNQNDDPRFEVLEKVDLP